ncbi:hypothetical protein G6F65_012569 [Rhizopus arrhizus]|nr:hypothetical protein G6F65_012569 [Rhizopus arrhizus]
MALTLPRMLWTTAVMLPSLDSSASRAVKEYSLLSTTWNLPMMSGSSAMRTASASSFSWPRVISVGANMPPAWKSSVFSVSFGAVKDSTLPA